MILKYKLIKTIIVVLMLGLRVGCSTAPVLPKETETSNESLSCSTSTLKNTDESINPEVAAPSKLNKPLAPVVPHCKACELLVESSKPVVTPSEVNKSIITSSKSNESVVTPSELSETVVKNDKTEKTVVKSDKTSNPVITSSPDKFLTVASILENAGFKVRSLDMSNFDAIGGGVTKPIYAALIEYICVLLDKYISLFNKLLQDTSKTIELLSQSNVLESGAKPDEGNMKDYPKAILSTHWKALYLKISVCGSPQTPKILHAAYGLWGAMLHTMGKMRELIDKAKSKENDICIVVEPFENGEDVKKTYFTISRLLVSIDQVELFIIELYKEYLRRSNGHDNFVVNPCSSSQTCFALKDKLSDSEELLPNKMYKEICSSVPDLNEEFPEAYEELLSKEETRFPRGRGGVKNVNALHFLNMLDGSREGMTFVMGNQIDKTKILVGPEYKEYLSYCEERLKGMLDALKMIKKEVNGIEVN